MRKTHSHQQYCPHKSSLDTVVRPRLRTDLTSAAKCELVDAGPPSGDDDDDKEDDDDSDVGNAALDFPDAPPSASRRCALRARTAASSSPAAA
jgi:hypothetical protein